MEQDLVSKSKSNNNNNKKNKAGEVVVFVK